MSAFLPVAFAREGYSWSSVNFTDLTEEHSYLWALTKLSIIKQFDSVIPGGGLRFAMYLYQLANNPMILPAHVVIM